MARELMTFDEAEKHAGSVPYAALEERVKQALPAYLWTYYQGAERRAYCSKCYTDSKIETLPDWVAADPYVEPDDAVRHPEWAWNMKGPSRSTQWKGKNALDGSGRHGHFGRCPACGELAQYRSMNLGRRTLTDRIFYLHYKRSDIEPDALVLTGWLAVREWGSWNENCEREPWTDISLREVCVFRPGRGGERFVAYPCEYTDGRDAGLLWEHRKQCKGGFDPVARIYFSAGTPYYMDQESVEYATGGTRWEAPLEALVGEPEYDELLDLINPIRFIAAWPCAEYMAKLGLGHLIKAAYLKHDEGCVNLRGKTAQKVLKVNGDDWGWIKGHKESCSIGFLRVLQRVRKEKRPISCRLIAEALRGSNAYALDRLINRTNGTATAAAIRYCVRKRVSTVDYADYLEQLEELEMDTKDQGILYPQDFEEQHRRLSERMKHKRDAEKDAEIMRNMEKLGVYWFSALGLTLRPMASSGEIIREGEIQHNCVGGYVNRYASGDTVILCLREDERLNEPYRTVEFSKQGIMMQCFGKRNKNPPDEQPRIDRFWQLFAAYRKEYERAHSKRRSA